MKMPMALALATICNILNALVLKTLAVDGISASATTVYRGTSCLILSVVCGILFGAEIRPKSYITQLARMTTAGTALFLLTAAYSGMRASSVALISRMDLPFTIILSGLFGFKTGGQQKVFAFLAIGLALSLASFEKNYNESTSSYLLAVLGSLLIGLGYLFLRKTATTENFVTLSLTPALGSILAGALASAHEPTVLVIPVSDLILTAISGLLMFFMYQLTRTAFQKLAVGISELYTVVGAVILVGIETLLFGDSLRFGYLITFLILAFITMIVALNPWRKQNVQ